MVGGTLLQPQSSVLPVTWQATIKPYKHQITHLGRVDIVISAENSGVKRGENRGPDLPYLPRHECRPKQKHRSASAPQQPR